MPKICKKKFLDLNPRIFFTYELIENNEQVVIPLREV